jgi:hypothetical protein
MEQTEKEAVLKSDTTTLYKIWSPDLIVNNPANTVVNLSQVKDRIKAGKIDYSSFDRIIEKISIIQNMAIVMGREEVQPQRNTDNAGKKVIRRYTNIWMEENGSWRLVGRQATISSIQ